MSSQSASNRAVILSRWAACFFILMVFGLMAWAGLNRELLTRSVSMDPLALLPKEQQSQNPLDRLLIQKALDHQSEFVSDKLIFLVNAQTPEKTAQAAEQLRAAWQVEGSLMKANSLQNSDVQQQFLSLYVPHQQHLLTLEQKSKYQSFNDEQWASEVLGLVSRPVSIGLPAMQDPMGNLQSWLMQQMRKSPLRQIEGGDWQVDLDGKAYTVLFYSATGDTFGLDAKHSVLTSFEQAKAQVQANDPSVTVLAAGIPLHAAAASAQAQFEMSWFGGLSTVVVLGLIFLAFMSIRPVLLIGLSLLVGTLLAYMATCFWFGQVHVVTLIFGTSLIGVAEDYGFHFLSARQQLSGESVWRVRKHVMMGLLLALVTTVFAYACLGLAPFPGLRQIAVFSSVGLLGAWLSVVLLFPFATGSVVKNTWLNQVFVKMWLRWLNMPRMGVVAKVMLCLLMIPLVFGLSRLTLKDDLRVFQNSPQCLVNEQQKIGQALNEANTEFLLVTGETPQNLLENEERLRAHLDALRVDKNIGDYRAVSEWLPSIAEQKNNEQLTLPLLKRLSQQLGMKPDEQVMISGQYLLPEAWLSQPVAQLVKSQWLGQQDDGRWANIVSLSGAITPTAISMLERLDQQDQQLMFINSVANYSALMSVYTHKILWFLGLAYLGTFFLLYLRYRGRASLILLPPLLASFLTLAVCGLFGIPVQLFTVLPLLLILGMGVDYGIFLVEHADEQAQTWMTICLSAMSTVLSLGLLAFSSTPALHTLGFCLGIGMIATWFIAACMGRFVYQRQLNRSV